MCVYICSAVYIYIYIYIHTHTYVRGLLVCPALEEMEHRPVHPSLVIQVSILLKKVTNRWTVGLSYKMTRMISTGKNSFTKHYR